MRDPLIDVLCLAPLVILLIGLTFAVLLDKYTRADQRMSLLMILLVEAILVAQDYVSWLLDPNHAALFARTVNSVVGYALRPLIFVLIFRLVAPHKRFWAAWVLVGLNAALYMTALFSHIPFFFDAEEGFVRQVPLGFTVFFAAQSAENAAKTVKYGAVAVAKSGQNDKKTI